MAAKSLTDALASLAPVAFSDVPSDASSLKSFLEDYLSEANLLVESVPLPQEPSTPIAPQHMSSSAILPVGPASDQAASMNPLWGKPLKIAAKDNPLNIPVYKLAARDGRGAWFARRSVHEGLNFDRWSEAIRREFPTSLAVQGAPGEGNIRGIGADRILENKEVEGCGRVDVYQLSAQFPGPTTPRDFVELLIISEKWPEKNISSRNAGRHMVVVSKPCAHPEAEPTDGFIRGAYESVEFIREIPTAPKAAKSAGDLRSLAKHQDSQKLTQAISSPSRPSTAGLGPSDPPVEWIHISRSDPGGSVPRFMVERGTPGSMVADAKKFVDWACSIDLSQDAPGVGAEKSKEQTRDNHQRTSNEEVEANAHEETHRSASDEHDVSSHEVSTGTAPDTTLPGSWRSPQATEVSKARPDESLFSSLSNATTSVAQAAWSQLGTYAPGLTGTLNSIPKPLERHNSIVPSPLPDRQYSSSSGDSSTPGSPSSGGSGSDDDDSFASAAATPAHSPSRASSTRDSQDKPDYGTREATLAASHAAKVAGLEAELAAIREKHSDDAKRMEKAEAQHAKNVEKAEAQHRKALDQLKASREKEAKHAEQRAKHAEIKEKKQAEKQQASARKSERKRLEKEEREMRRRREKEEREVRKQREQEVKSLRAELGKVRNEKDSIAEVLRRVQAENTALIAQVAKLEGGPELLEEVKKSGGLGSQREESVKSARGSVRSTRSGKSPRGSFKGSENSGHSDKVPFKGPGE